MTKTLLIINAINCICSTFIIRFSGLFSAYTSDIPKNALMTSHSVIKFPATPFLYTFIPLVSSVHTCFLLCGFTSYLCGHTTGSNEISHAIKFKLNFAFMSLTSLIVYNIYSSFPCGGWWTQPHCWTRTL